uniref:TPR domain protein, putative component of TonB system n=1 Tax=Rheinheimera sp. BAL341 TaxID=1708203 RepID=A0A486XJW1_9GAMM
MRPVRLILSVLVVLQGCSQQSLQPQRPRLADLPAFDRSVLHSDIAVSEQQLGQLYQQILTLQPADATRQKILYRLSQMYTQQLEQAQLPPAEEQQALQQLVQRYQQLLQDYPQDPNNELIRYQLARSYDLLARQDDNLQQLDILLRDYPQAPFIGEIWFRKADIHYSRAEYQQALPAYLAVLQANAPELKQHARYMAGWSYFKLQQFSQADEQFLQLLDSSDTELLLAQDSQSRQSLRDEVMRTLSISLSYQQQGTSLQALLQRVPYYSGERPLQYVAQLYQYLAVFLAEKQLYNESLQSYRLFVSDYAYSLTAARFQLKIIDAYLQNADADMALSEQQRYIDLFGPDAEFWQQAPAGDIAQVSPYLLQYLDYFARTAYNAALAMPLTAPERKGQFAAAIPLWQQMLTVLKQPGLPHTAGSAYSAADLHYLLAESYAGAEQHEAALALYTELGFQAVSSDASLFTAADAAYKALLLSQKLVDGPVNTQRAWQLQSQFVSYHSQHPAAQQVALQQLQQRYNEQDYQAVLNYSRSVIVWPHPAQSQDALVAEAQFLHSQSELALSYFADAERSIDALLQQQLSPQRRELLTTQLASSIYQQAQQSSAATAQRHLQRLLTVLPDSPYHEAAAFQQIELLRAGADFSGAIANLTGFITRYANSERITTANALLLDSYEQAGQWRDAAALLLSLAAQGSTEQQREALYLAAQYYQRAGDIDNALRHWRDYANRYHQPHLLAQEARLQLVGLYQQRNDLYRQNFWRDKIAVFEQQFAAQGNSRSQQLAAQALLELGRHNSMLFSAVRLAHPLSQSLKQKQQHMTVAISHYQQSMQFGVAELLTEAQFQVAQLYQQMAKAIIASDRPTGLDELALEEYELLLEEQAYPFEEKAIAIYQLNTALTQQALWDSWIEQSFHHLSLLLPAKFNKPESYSGVTDAAY